MLTNYHVVESGETKDFGIEVGVTTAKINADGSADTFGEAAEGFPEIVIRFTDRVVGLVLKVHILGLSPQPFRMPGVPLFKQP